MVNGTRTVYTFIKRKCEPDKEGSCQKSQNLRDAIYELPLSTFEKCNWFAKLNIFGFIFTGGTAGAIGQRMAIQSGGVRG